VGPFSDPFPCVLPPQEAEIQWKLHEESIRQSRHGHHASPLKPVSAASTDRQATPPRMRSPAPYDDTGKHQHQHQHPYEPPQYPNPSPYPTAAPGPGHFRGGGSPEHEYAARFEFSPSRHPAESDFQAYGPPPADLPPRWHAPHPHAQEAAPYTPEPPVEMPLGYGHGPSPTPGPSPYDYRGAPVPRQPSPAPNQGYHREWSAPHMPTYAGDSYRYPAHGYEEAPRRPHSAHAPSHARGYGPPPSYGWGPGPAPAYAPEKEYSRWDREKDVEDHRYRRANYSPEPDYRRSPHEHDGQQPPRKPRVRGTADYPVDSPFSAPLG
jgi:hypothetical protein